MPSSISRLWQGWRGICLVAITYVYFLIFAQFGFLKRLAELGIADTHLKTVMAVMAASGILFSLLTPRTTVLSAPSLRMRLALSVCALSACLTWMPLTLPASIVTALLIGSGLGVLTVTLVTHLRMWLAERNQLIHVALGTGIGYAVCNVPALFTSSPRHQALVAAVLCLVGAAIVSETSTEPASTPPYPVPASFLRILACFTALIWLDSAAFFIIQNTPALKAGTWEGTAHLLANAALHLLAALACAWLLRRRGLSPVLISAFLALASACLLLLYPNRIVLASVFYPVGVSLYSVALVAYPSLLAPGSSAKQRGIQAGWIYSIAGWLGSAMGIGMGQNLGHVPPVFVLLAGTPILVPPFLGILRRRTREIVLTATVLLAAFCMSRAIVATHPRAQALTQVERGRQIYISEGCINCHSQYVRPQTADVTMWGPTQTLEELRREHPPLIGNRRQGPDLSEVGNRRSPLWLKAHFYNPSEVSHASFMPSYAYLFQTGDTRGEDLMAYLQTLKGDQSAEHLGAERDWLPSPATLATADTARGAQIFQFHCATCHTGDGATRLTWQRSFRRQPPYLSLGHLEHVPASISATERTNRLAQIVKFGLPGTDMPGHEYLPDRDIASLALWLSEVIPDTANWPQLPSGGNK